MVANGGVQPAHMRADTPSTGSGLREQSSPVDGSSASTPSGFVTVHTVHTASIVPRGRSPVLPPLAGVEAVAAVHRSITTRHERHLGFRTTGRAHRVVPLVGDFGAPPGSGGAPGAGTIRGERRLAERERVRALVEADELGVPGGSLCPPAIRAFARFAQTPFLPKLPFGGRYEERVPAYRTHLFIGCFRAHALLLR